MADGRKGSINDVPDVDDLFSIILLSIFKQWKGLKLRIRFVICISDLVHARKEGCL